MTNSRRLYSAAAVSNYLGQLENADIYTLPGCLADNYIIFHYDAAGEPAAVEVLKEMYLNHWESGTARNLYRARVPQTIIDFVLSYVTSYDDEETKRDAYWIAELLTTFNLERRKAA